MGEYGRRQRNKQSMTIANGGTGSRQLKRFIDNRSSIVLQNKSIDFVQCNKADLLCKPCDNYSNTIQMITIECSTTLKDKVGGHLVDAKNITNGERNDDYVKKSIDNSAFKSLLDKVTQKEKWSKYHCAEPQSLAKALNIWRSNSPDPNNPPVTASISKATNKFEYPSDKKRCKNCEQWVPSGEQDINAIV